MHRGKFGHLPQAEDTRGKADDEEGCLGVEGSANDFCTRLVEEVATVNTPSSVGDGMLKGKVGGRGRSGGSVKNIHLNIGVLLRDALLCLPYKYCAVPRNGVNL